MTRPKPIVFGNLLVFAALNIEATIQARANETIDDETLILANLIVFARDLTTADFMLNLMGYWPECEIIFYLHLPKAKEYKPLIRAVSPNQESFPYFYQN